VETIKRGTFAGLKTTLSSHDAFLYERDVHWWKKGLP
jgi:hypothetical protein